MTSVERQIAAEKNLVLVQMVVDTNLPLRMQFDELAHAVANTSHEYFAKRFEHYCSGGLVSRQEATVYSELINKRVPRQHA